MYIYILESSTPHENVYVQISHNITRKNNIKRRVDHSAKSRKQTGFLNAII